MSTKLTLSIAEKANQQEATIRALRDELATMKQRAELAEAKVDRLMLEYCPDEMTEAQIEGWAKHQVPVDAKTEALIDGAISKDA